MERNSEEKSDKYRVNLGVWQPKIGRSFAIWQFGRTFGFPKDENSVHSFWIWHISHIHASFLVHGVQYCWMEWQQHISFRDGVFLPHECICDCLTSWKWGVPFNRVCHIPCFVVFRSPVMILWMGDLLPLHDCNCSISDHKPDLLLPVYQFLFVVVYRDADCSSHWCPPLFRERVTWTTHSSTSHPLHRVHLTKEASHPLGTLDRLQHHHVHVRILRSWTDWVCVIVWETKNGEGKETNERRRSRCRVEMRMHRLRLK